jgi:hypothetical protein
MAPYSLQQNTWVFPNPLKWEPGRWLRSDGEPALVEIKKWFWALGLRTWRSDAYWGAVSTCIQKLWFIQSTWSRSRDGLDGTCSIDISKARDMHPTKFRKDSPGNHLQVRMFSSDTFAEMKVCASPLV